MNTYLFLKFILSISINFIQFQIITNFFLSITSKETSCLSIPDKNSDEVKFVYPTINVFITLVCHNPFWSYSEKKKKKETNNNK